MLQKTKHKIQKKALNCHTINIEDLIEIEVSTESTKLTEKDTDIKQAKFKEKRSNNTEVSQTRSQIRSTLKSTARTQNIQNTAGIDKELEVQDVDQDTDQESPRSTLKSTVQGNSTTRENQTRSQSRSTSSGNTEQSKEDGERQPVNFGISTRSTPNPITEGKGSTSESTQSEDTVILQTTEEEDLEFPDELNNLITNILPIDSEIKETRKVYLNNDWQITDSIGNLDFIGLIENNSNMDLLSYITEKLPL